MEYMNILCGHAFCTLHCTLPLYPTKSRCMVGYRAWYNGHRGLAMFPVPWKYCCVHRNWQQWKVAPSSYVRLFNDAPLTVVGVHCSLPSFPGTVERVFPVTDTTVSKPRTSPRKCAFKWNHPKLKQEQIPNNILFWHISCGSVSGLCNISHVSYGCPRTSPDYSIRGLVFVLLLFGHLMLTKKYVYGIYK